MGDYWLILIEIAIGIGILLLYLSARKAFSSEDVRRTMITENERLSGAVERLAEEFEARVERAIEALNAAISRAEEAARRLDELAAGAGLDRDRASAQDPRTTALSDKHRRVVDLAGQGMSIESIAKDVELGTGEVELVLNITKEGSRQTSYISEEAQHDSRNPKGRKSAT